MQVVLAFIQQNLGGIGDGGAIVTSNINLMDEIRCLRQYGWNENRISKAVEWYPDWMSCKLES